MTGITLDLFTVILIIILAFICGYSAGHRFGRNEVYKFIMHIIKTVSEYKEKGVDIREVSEEELEKILLKRNNEGGHNNI